MKKIVVIGAGSASFGLANLGGLMRTKGLHGSELCLVDINRDGLEQIAALAGRINGEWDAGFRIRHGTDRADFLRDADFVILSVAVDREKCWRMDHEIAKRHGIMHYAENGGPGGLMHASRNIALIMPILRDVEKYCPKAVVLNFTNPVPRICIAAKNYTGVDMVGICHQIQFGYLMAGVVLADELGIEVRKGYTFRWDDKSGDDKRIRRLAAKKLDILAAGINHFTWMLSVREKEGGADLYPLLKERFLNGGNPAFEPLTREMIRTFGFCPVPGDCHMVEYLPYTHDMAAKSWEKYDIQMYPLDKADDRREELWEKIRAIAGGRLPADELKNVETERAELIVEAIAGNGRSYEPAVNIPNRGYITNLPQNAVVEVPAVVSADGVMGVGVGSLPEPVAELCRRQIAVAELAVKAGTEGNREYAIEALALDPMVDGPDTARALFDEYLENEKQYLPQFTGKARLF